MSTSSAPQPLDPNLVAGIQQSEFNLPSALESQAGSMVDQANPYGTMSYEQIGTGPGGIPLYGTSTDFSAPQQQLYNQYTGSQITAGNQGFNLLNNANYGGQSPTQAIGTETSGIQGGLMSQWLQSQAPWMQMQNTQLQTELENKGLNPSPTATSDPSTWGPFEQQMGQLQQAQDMAVAGAATQFQPTAFSEASTLYGLPAQLGAQLSAFGQPTSPSQSLVQTPVLNVNPANFEGDVAQSENINEQNYQTQLALQSSLLSGLFGATGNVLGGLARGGAFSSDKRLKKNIKKIGKVRPGINLYEFEFFFTSDKHIGVMADEVKKIIPEAVITFNGFDRVDYALLGL